MRHSSHTIPIAPTWLAALALAACAPQPEPPALDEPLDGLTEEELERFEEGEEIFEGTFTAEQGLGPLFNADSCAGCHSDPVDGGNGSFVELHATGFGPEGTCDPLFALGGPVFQLRATEALAAHGITSEPLPPEALAQARRTTPDVFGFGLLDAVPDAEILALADPDDRDGDGVSGRVHWLPGGRIGRFGRKAAVSALADFNEGAFLFELGLTTPRLDVENSIAGAPLPDGVDPLPEPEASAESVALVDDYVRFLAPPAPARRDVRERTGERLFRTVGCATCHVPSLRTGDHVVKALAHRDVHAYTDLLLHDMGPALADICLEGAEPSEFRTEPLMGLRHVTAFLHDGRAATIEEAILAHDGEGRAAREEFEALGSGDHEALLAFLRTL
jgi:CxxC motif-containing protein (DUF1111 family)